MTISPLSPCISYPLYPITTMHGNSPGEVFSAEHFNTWMELVFRVNGNSSGGLRCPLGRCFGYFPQRFAWLPPFHRPWILG
jgi:hypothetical protein